MNALRDKIYVLAKLEWMRKNRIWPNGLRYLWTDAFGVVLLVSLHEESGRDEYLSDAEWVVAEVDRVLGRERGIRIGEESDRDGQYFHYLALWLYALSVLGRYIPSYRERGIELVKQIHSAFLLPGQGVIWKMKEDLSGPYPGYGLGALDAFDGYIAYRMLDDKVLAVEIADMADLMNRSARDLVITQDLGLGMMLWLSHFFPEEPWAVIQRRRSLLVLDSMWRPEGHFCREPRSPGTKFAFTNYGISLGLQAVGAMPHRVGELNRYFESHGSGDEYDTSAITHVMACTSHFPGLMLRNSTESQNRR